MKIETFACPLGGDAQELADWLTARFFIMLDRWIDNEPILSKDSPYNNFKEQLGNTKGWSSLWRPELGVVNTALSKDEFSQERRAIRCQLDIVKYLSGLVSELAIDVYTKFEFTVSGRQIAPGRLQVLGAQDEFIIVSRDKATEIKYEYKKIRLSKEFTVWLSDTCEVISHQDWFLAMCVPGSKWYEYWGGERILNSYSVDFQEFVRSLLEVLDVLNHYIPEYKQWVSLLVREFTPLLSAGKGSDSASFKNFPGHIHFSIPYSVSSGIVTMIHESSHQFFNLLEWNMQLVKNDIEIYSILKNSHRPLLKVLLGYHAFANALIGLVILRDRGFFDQDYDRVFNHTCELVNSLGKSIENVGLENLTEIGMSLYLPLRSTVNDIV
ncbi:MAG: hypothetical protein N5P05_004305 (plasmid) [Chroococcopsis gigantea SAG 12.99]|jgi:hypothetical protein|nr:hypothetical protein [Chroococcopsis gigantea SAG 12.99]